MFGKNVNNSLPMKLEVMYWHVQNNVKLNVVKRLRLASRCSGAGALLLLSVSR